MITLRTATLADAPAVANLHATSWRYAYRGAYSDEYLDGDVFADRAQWWDGRLSSPLANQYVLLAEDEGELVGFACAFAADDEQWGTLVDNLHVSPERHRQGIGCLLLAGVAKWCMAEHPGVPMYLWVLEQNDRGHRFYEALGGANVGTQQSTARGGGTITAHRMAWTPEQVSELAQNDTIP